MCLSLWLLAKVMSRFPDQDLFQAMIKRFPVFGRTVAFMFVGNFFTILVRDIRTVVDFINLALLPTTPLWVLSALSVFTIVLIAHGGVETLGRMTELYAPILITVIVLVPFVLLKEFDETLLMPYFKVDFLGVAQGSWFVVAYIGEIIALPFLFTGRTFQFKYGLKGLLLGTSLLLILVVSAQFILGTHLIIRTLYPTYELVRQLKITDFLDRFDLPLVGIWLPSMLTKIAYSLFLVCHGLKRIVPDLPARLSVSSIGVLGFVCSFWFFQNAIQLFNFNRTWTVIALFFEVFIPIMLFFVLKPKKRTLW
jgi:spore germination protein